MSCRLEVAPPLATLTLATHPLHVLNLEGIGELQRALDSVAARGDISVLVLASEGEKAFSAGVEVRDHLPDRLDDMIESFHGVCLYREELASTEDMLEGLNAFLEKRKPIWRGR